MSSDAWPASSSTPTAGISAPASFRFAGWKFHRFRPHKIRDARRGRISGWIFRARTACHRRLFVFITLAKTSLAIEVPMVMPADSSNQ